jgi:hypothetical protein
VPSILLVCYGNTDTDITRISPKMVTTTLCLRHSRHRTQTDANVVSNNKAPLATTVWRHRETGWERRSCTLPAAATRTRDMGAKFLVTVSSPPSPACTSVAPLAQLECSAESHGCEGVSGVSERRLRMKWIHVAGLARLSCKNMPQEMRVFMNRCKPKEGSQLRRKVSLA